MSNATRSTEAAASAAGLELGMDKPRPQLRGLRWVIRQTLLGIVVLGGFVAGGAWLLHASIDPSSPESGSIEKSE